jgi:tetratricopeptide (TPR) repeat protein
MGFLDKIKKNIIIESRADADDSVLKSEKKILVLEEKIKENPKNVQLLFELYICYVIVGDLEKKITCLEKVSLLSPNDPYPLQQLADIYAVELKDMEKSQFYQTQANKIRKFF